MDDERLLDQGMAAVPAPLLWMLNFLLGGLCWLAL